MIFRKANQRDIPYMGHMRVKKGHIRAKKGKDEQREAGSDIKLNIDIFD